MPVMFKPKKVNLNFSVGGGYAIGRCVPTEYLRKEFACCDGVKADLAAMEADMKEDALYKYMLLDMQHCITVDLKCRHCGDIIKDLAGAPVVGLDGNYAILLMMEIGEGTFPTVAEAEAALMKIESYRCSQLKKTDALWE